MASALKWLLKSEREAIIATYVANLRAACLARGVAWSAEIEAALVSQFTESILAANRVPDSQRLRRRWRKHQQQDSRASVRLHQQQDSHQ